VKKILILLCIGISVLAVILSQFVITTHVDCKSQYGDCPIEVANKISPLNGKKIFVVRKDLKKILASDLLVSNYSIRFKLPNILHVELLVKKPLFALKNTTSNSFALIDKDGQVLADSESSDLPTVSTDEELPKVGQTVNDETLFALKLIGGVYQMYQIGGGEIQGDTLLVDLPGPVRVIFPLVGADSGILLGSLRLIYSNIQNAGGGTTYREIDMRYINPVLR
jgi:hypothetical protein